MSPQVCAGPANLNWTSVPPIKYVKSSLKVTLGGTSLRSSVPSATPGAVSHVFGVVAAGAVAGRRAADGGRGRPAAVDWVFGGPGAGLGIAHGSAARSRRGEVDPP